MLTEMWGLAEADFQHYYRLDLRTEVQRSGCRRLWALVNGLPVDSAVRREGKAWTQADELAAALIEQLDRWAAAFVGLMTSKGKTQIPAPLEIRHRDREVAERPVRERQVRRLSIAEFETEWTREEATR